MFGVSGPPRFGLIDRSLHEYYLSSLNICFLRLWSWDELIGCSISLLHFICYPGTDDSLLATVSSSQKANEVLTNMSKQRVGRWRCLMYLADSCLVISCNDQVSVSAYCCVVLWYGVEGLIKYSHFCHPPIRTGNSVPRGTGISWSCPVLWYILPIFHQCLKCCNCRIHKSNIKLIIFASIYWIKLSIDMKKYLQVSFYRIRRNKSCFIVNSVVHLYH
jgi:hypothetical protein